MDNPALNTLIRCAGNLVRDLDHACLHSGGQTRVDNVSLHQLRDAYAAYQRSLGVQCRLDIASRSVSDDRPLRPAIGTELAGGVCVG